MINTSKLVLFTGLLYHYMSLASGVQTIRPSWPGPVSCLLGGTKLAGCFLSSLFGFSIIGVR
jgi:hypothetical protein